MSKLNHFKLFIIELFNQVMKNDILSLSNALAYKIVISVFPFLVFLMTILGFLNLDTSELEYQLAQSLPSEVMEIINVFIEEVIDTKNVSLMSTSLFIAIFSAANGLKAILRGINRAYGLKDSRGLIAIWATSIGLVFIFTISVVTTILLIVFGNNIIDFLAIKYELPYKFVASLNVLAYIITSLTLITTTMVVYKFSCCKRISIRSVFPGAFVTVVFWILLSKLFNLYIMNFARYSLVYGSVGGIIIFLFWLNMLLVVLLVGCNINVLIRERSENVF